MKTRKYTYWKDGEYYLGYWNEYPEYQTQALSKDELIENLKSLLFDLESGENKTISQPASFTSCRD
ncbi:MAG: hypothetical protein BWY58_00727 [Chloroflexi bacterium ADurb.Bin344]|jgi:predicted RNase H-like HicB family nuclease|nr:MAG: hypothetical protein BWY58_00727 [Chloroflexi bacterium ADurb.Bin344]